MPTCPKCGSKGPFRYLENIVCWRVVVGVNDEGHLIVDALYSSGEGYDTLMPPFVDGNGEVYDCDQRRFEALVDAQTGQLLSFEDTNHYAEVKGGGFIDRILDALNKGEDYENIEWR